MKPDLATLNKAFESRVRLGVMSLLALHGTVEFTALRDQLDLTDGNLASHLKALEKEGYVAVRKSFIGRKPSTDYRITDAGRDAFAAHLSALETLIRSLHG